MKKARKKTSKRKKSNAPKILLGLAAIGGAAYLGYKYWWLPRQAAKEEAPADRVDQPTNEQVINTAIQNVDQAPANIAPSKLSPIGTPVDQINFNAVLYMGDKGAEVVYVQRMANKIRAIIKGLRDRGFTNAGYGLEITPDGKYGPLTYKAFSKLGWTRKQGITPKQALSDFVKWREIMKTKYTETVASAQGQFDQEPRL